MNKAYRLVWCIAKDAWVVAAETVKGKCGSRPVTVAAMIATALLPLITTLSHALPAAPNVVSGIVGISTVGNTMTVTNTPSSIVNWGSFSIAANETTKFIQQSATSSILNRVIGADASRIYGAMQSNGKVFLVNQNGILIGPTAQINVNGFVASALNISNQDFLAGKMQFNAGAIAGSIENEGTITTPSGGEVMLIAPDVTNKGIINSPNGDILLAAGNDVLLVEKTNPEIALVVSASENQAINLGQLSADAGRIGMYGGMVRQKGVISANSAVKDASGRIFLKATKDVTVEAGSLTAANGPDGGSIVVHAGEGTTLVSGTLEAKGAAGVGGTVHILGRRVGLLDDALVDASGTAGGGTVLVGGDYQGKNPDIRNAGATYMGSDAVVKADATDNGNGGKVILWADDTTRYFGTISAKGGIIGGNGGVVEVSGKKILNFLGKVDATALNGRIGTLLLDPDNIVVQTGGGALASDVDAFADQPGTTQTIDPATLNGVGASVTLQATNEITFTDALTLTTAVAGLTAQAGNNIFVNNLISTNAGDVSLTATAGSVNVSGAITSGNGNVDITGNSINFTAAGDITAGVGTVNLTSTGASALTSIVAGTAISGADINIKTDQISLAGTLGATNIVGITRQNNNVEVQVGTGAIDSASTLGIDDTELSNILAGIYRFGDTTSTGGLRITGNVVIPATRTLTLLTSNIGGSQIVQDAGSITADYLRLEGGSGVTLNIANDNFVTNLSGKTISGEFRFKNSPSLGLNISTVDGQAGIDAGANNILLTGGTLTDSVSATITANALTVGTSGGMVLDANHAVSGFNASNSTTGGINFINTMPTLTIGTVTQTGSAPVVIENSGNISLGQIDGGGGVVTLRAHSGSITDANGSSDNVINAFRVDFNDGSTITPGGVGTAGDAIEIYNAASDSKVTAWANSGGINIEKTSGTFAIDLQGIAHTGNTTGDIDIMSNAGIINSAGLVTSAGNNGNVILESLGGPGFVTVNAPINKAGSGTLTLQSYTGTDINIASNIFGNTGDIRMDSGSNINVTAGSISANNIELNANGSIADSGAITADTLKISAGGNVSLTGANMVNTLAANMPFATNLNFNNNQSLTIGTAGAINGINFSDNPNSINIKTFTGNLTVSQPVNAGPMGGGQIALESAGTLNINNSVTSSFNATPGLIKLTAGGGGVTSTVAGIISGNLEVVSGGDAFLDLAPNVVPLLSASVSGGGFSFNNSGSFAVGVSGGTTGLTAATGDITLKAGSPNALLTIGQNVQATSGSVYYVTDNLAHNAYTTTSGSPGNYVEVRPYTAATNIEFSSLADAAGYLRLSSSELYFSTPMLKLGNNAMTGNISINEDIAPTAFNTLSLITSGSISQTVGSTITIASLNADGWGGVTLPEANAVSYLGGHTDSSNAFVFNDTSTLTVKQVDIQNGINSPGGNITLTTAADIKNNEGTPVISTAGTLTANAVAGIILTGNNSAATVALNNTASGNINYEASLSSLAVSASNVSAGSVTVINSGSLVVNNVVAGSGAVTLTGSGNVTLGAASSSTSVNVVSTTGSIVDGNGTSPNITANALQLSAYSGIGTGDPLETQIGFLTATNSTAGGVYLNNSGNLTIDGISAATSNIKVGNTGGWLEVSGPVTGNNITLFSDTSFNNSYGAGALVAGARWLVWSADPSLDTRGGLTCDFKQYNATEGVTSVAQPTGNGLLYSLAPIVTASLTGSVTKTYDGTINATLAAANYSVSGAVDGDTVVLSNPVSGSFDTKNVGSGKSITVSGISVSSANNGGIPVSGYGVSSSIASGAIGSISTKPLTVSATVPNKVYDGATSATVSLADDRVSGDILVLDGIASFSDKNIAAGKTVSVSGITVSGTDAANYTFNTTASSFADITIRPLSTWIGGATGLWSSAANWDAVPDLSNVQAVSIPSGNTVTYDATAGVTNLSSLTAAGLAITGGNLTIASALTVTSSFSQTGGTLDFGGGASATITQASGNLSVPALTVSSLALAAPGGTISQTGAIITTSLDTSSATGTVLNGANQVTNFSASNSTSGNIELTNTASPLNVGAITQSATADVVINNTGAMTTGASPVTSGGSVSLIVHSPLTIGSGGISAGSNIVLTAGSSGAGSTVDILTINGPVSAAGSITLSAGNAIQGTNVPSGGNVTSTSDTNGASTPTTVELVPTTNQIVTESGSIETTPVAPTGLILVALAEPQEETLSTASLTPEDASAVQSGNLSDDGSSKEEEIDKNENGKDNENKESKSDSGDKKDANPKKNYCN